MSRAHRSFLRAIALTLLATAGCGQAPPGEDVGATQSALKVCGSTSVKGIDVYHGDNGGAPIDWVGVKNAGTSFAFAKATESTDFHDSMFQTNWNGIKAAGLVRGAYHYFHADVDGVAQARFFLSAVGTPAEGDLLFLDLESTNGRTQAQVAAGAAAFLGEVASATGMTPFLYTSPAFLSDYSALAAYPLWVANYGVTCPDVPAAWTTYTFWQSTGTGSLTGISGQLDLDSFNGTLAELLALGGKTSQGGDDAGVVQDDASAPQDDAAGGTDGGGLGGDGGEVTTAVGSGGGCACTASPGDGGTPWGLGRLALAWFGGRWRRRPRTARPPSS